MREGTDVRARRRRRWGGIDPYGFKLDRSNEDASLADVGEERNEEEEGQSDMAEGGVGVMVGWAASEARGRTKEPEGSRASFAASCSCPPSFPTRPSTLWEPIAPFFLSASPRCPFVLSYNIPMDERAGALFFWQSERRAG